MVSEKGQLLNNGQNWCSHFVLYSEVRLYKHYLYEKSIEIMRRLSSLQVNKVIFHNIFLALILSDNRHLYYLMATSIEYCETIMNPHPSARILKIYRVACLFLSLIACHSISNLALHFKFDT